jgi:hypothetical protein
MNIDDNTIQQMAELAFIAGGYGMVAQSELIAAGLQTLRPDSERPQLIRAVTRLSVKDTVNAEQILRDGALKTNPNSTMAKAMLGLVLHVQGRTSERDRVLHEVTTVRDDDDAVRIANDLLGTAPPA